MSSVWSKWWFTWRSGGTSLSRKFVTLSGHNLHVAALNWVSQRSFGPYGLHSSSSESISTAFVVFSMEHSLASRHSRLTSPRPPVSTAFSCFCSPDWRLMALQSPLARLCEPGSGFGRSPLLQAWSAIPSSQSEFQESAPRRPRLFTRGAKSWRDVNSWTESVKRFLNSHVTLFLCNNFINFHVCCRIF